MKIQNAKQDIQKLLSCFSEAFSRPSFKIFSSFITGFIQLGKEAHTSSMVQSLTYPFLHRSLSSFTRFLGQNTWALEEVAEIALEQIFHTLRIQTHSVLFLIIDDTIAQKSGKKVPGCSWYKDHAQNMANVFGHQWVPAALLYKDFLLPLLAKLYHPKGAKGCGRFQTKITIAQRIIQGLRLPLPCKLYVLVDSWYWAKTLANVCRKCGYQMISQLKSMSVLWMNGKKTKVTTLSTLSSAYREVSPFLYGKNKTLTNRSIIVWTLEIKQTYLKCCPTSVPSPCRWGRVTVGMDKKQSGSPSPSSPPTKGRGDFGKNMSSQLWTH